MAIRMKYKNLFKSLEKKYLLNKVVTKNSYPLLDDAFTFDDLQKGIDVISSINFGLRPA